MIIIILYHFFFPFLPPFSAAAPPAGALAAAVAAFAAYYFLRASKLALILKKNLNKIIYCCFVHSEGLMTCTTIMSIKMLSHINSLWALWTWLMRSLNSTFIVNSIEFKCCQLNFSVSVLLLLWFGEILLLLLLLFSTFCININIINTFTTLSLI